MRRSRTDVLMATALRLASKAVEERANGEDLEELALVILELDEAIVIDGEDVPRRWASRARMGTSKRRGLNKV